MPSTPKEAKRVFKGKIFDIYQWEQSLFDGTKRTFEMVKRNPSIQIITVTNDKKLIILKEKQPFVGKFIAIPGGRVERKEKSRKAAQRELLEETGMIPKKMFLWKKVNCIPYIDWCTRYYIAQGCTKIQESKDTPSEVSRVYKLSFEDFIQQTQKKSFRNRIFSDMVFRIIHTKGELEKFKKLLLGE